jgi:hypothetical protein
MKRITNQAILNIVFIIYLMIWIYYAAFNWEVFSIKLNTNAGFSVIRGYPFVFFFLLGLVAFLILKYFLQIDWLLREKREKERSGRINLLQKDIELLKMKEVLFKMQSKEMSKNSTELNALHEKLDELSKHISGLNPDTDDAEEEKSEN